MSVEETDVVDLASVNEESGSVILTVSDHLNWSDSVGHQTILQKKLNAYLAFVESGELVLRYPPARTLPVAIKIVFKYRPDQEGERFLERARDVIESAGISFCHEVFAASYDN